METAKKPVFYVYDERMLKHREFPKPQPEGSTEKVHINPEVPDRVKKIHEYLQNEGLLDKMEKLEVAGMDEIESLIEKIHSRDLINLVKSSCERLGEGESCSSNINPGKGEIYECKDTYEAALVSAASAVTAVREILDGDDSSHERGYCIIRPPGHHAYHNLASGFCFFNNAALAAKIALDAPYNLKKVAIFDWDIHHGDGTQSMFYEDERLLFMSLHRRDNLTFYPNKVECSSEFIGDKAGKGFNINIPWETGLEVDEFDRMNNKVSELGNTEYRYACDTLLVPVVEEFKPELIIISCGFDSAIHDFLGWSNVTPLMYEYMTRKLHQICPKVLVI